MTALNIHVFVDVVALLSGAPAARAVHMFDDGRCGSKGLGSAALVSSVLPGQLLRWTVTPIDVQTQVWIRDIAFGPAPEPTAPVVDSETAEEGATEAPGAPVTSDEAPEAGAPEPVPVWARRFEGFVPFEIVPNAPHPYRIDLCFAAARGPSVTIRGPALRFGPGQAPAAGDPGIL